MATETGADVLLLYGPPWRDAARFSKHHLARFLADRGRRVFYVEAPLGPLSLLRRRTAARDDLRMALGETRRIGERLWVRRYFNPFPYHSFNWLTQRRVANRLGQALLGQWMRRDLQRLGMSKPVLIAGLPHARDVLSHVPHRLVVYHCADDYTEVSGFPVTLKQLEREMCEAADLVVTTAETLCQQRRKYNRHTFWVPNGADVEFFSQPVKPAPDVPAWAGPVIGFVGSIGQWVDVPLLAEIARSRPDALLLLVGPVSTDVGALRGLANVAFLGPRSYGDVPAYLASMDVAVVPFRPGPVTWSADPIKAYEYLAAGVPVVGTDVPALRRLGSAVRLASDPAGFREQLAAAISLGREAGRTERQAEARKHSWESRFREFERLLREAEAACAC